MTRVDTGGILYQVLRSLERLDLSMNRIASFEEIGALFSDEACVNMSILELRNNPVSKQHKLRDYVALMSPTLAILDGREITQVEHACARAHTHTHSHARALSL